MEKSMKDQKIREALEELHLELLTWAPHEKLQQEKRDALAAYIRDVLDRGNLEQQNILLSDALNESVVAFEEAHPKVAQLIGSLKSMLSSIGL